MLAWKHLGGEGEDMASTDVRVAVVAAGIGQMIERFGGLYDWLLPGSTAVRQGTPSDRALAGGPGSGVQAGDMEIVVELRVRGGQFDVFEHMLPQLFNLAGRRETGGARLYACMVPPVPQASHGTPQTFTLIARPA